MSLEKQIIDSIIFKVGDVVYLITDDEQKKRIVSGLCIRKNGVTYELSCGISTSWHYGFEITETVNVKIKTEN